MSRIDNIITEAINNQVNLSVARVNRDEIERRVHSIESNGNAMQNQFVADTVAYGYGIINAYDRGNVGQSTERNTVYRGYNNNYVGNGFGYRFIRGALNDLGRAGFSQLTNPLQSSLNDYINGKNWYYRNFGNRNAQQTQQRRPNNGAYANNTLMDLLSPSERNRRRNELRQVYHTLPTRTSDDMFEFFRQAEAMYIALTNGQPQQSAAQMQAGQQAQQNQQQRVQAGQQPPQGTQTGTQPAQGTPGGTRRP